MRAKRGGNQAAFNRANEARHKNVFDSGVWPLPSNLEDLELRRLAKALPATVLNCKVDSTTEKYLRTFQRQKTWAEAIQATLGGLRQELAKPKKRKEPVTSEMLQAMVEAMEPLPSLTEVHLLVISLV
ncbi:hypothetical protein EMCRGX_G000061 [Ephydatia muelleri]